MDSFKKAVSGLAFIAGMHLGIGCVPTESGDSRDRDRNPSPVHNGGNNSNNNPNNSSDDDFDWNPFDLTPVNPDNSAKTFYPTQDTYVSSGNPTSSYGRDGNILTGRNEIGSKEILYTGLIKFDVSELRGEQIEEARLELTVSNSPNSKYFVEGNLTISASHTSWNENTNYLHAPSSSEYVTSRRIDFNSGQAYRFDVTNVVSKWSSGSLANNGLVLRTRNLEKDDSGIIFSKDLGGGGLSPRLKVRVR